MKHLIFAVIIILTAVCGVGAGDKKTTLYAGVEHELQENYFIDVGGIVVVDESNMYGGWLGLNIVAPTQVPLKIKLNQIILANGDAVVGVTSIRTVWSFNWDPYLRK
jgi:hypothetical protein